MTELSMDEMMAAIADACHASRQLPPSDSGVTPLEYAKHEGCGEQRARRELTASVEAGRVKMGKRWFVDRAGRVVSVTVYRPV